MSAPTWTCETNGKEWWVQTPAPFREGIAECIRSEEHARLIAAAPDTFAALKGLLSLFEEIDGGENDDAPEFLAARAALARAQP